MIARLRGIVDHVEDGRCIIDVNGVGYLLFCSTRTLSSLPEGMVTVLVETQVREDAITLYGFSTTAERLWFRLLTTVQGVGARLALSVLSGLSPDQLVGAITGQDKAAFTRIAGVGPKLALRILTELREKAGVMPGDSTAMVPSLPASQGTMADALSALVNLGYRRAEAEQALAKAVEAHGEEADLEQLVRAGLRALMK